MPVHNNMIVVCLNTHASQGTMVCFFEINEFCGRCSMVLDRERLASSELQTCFLHSHRQLSMFLLDPALFSSHYTMQRAQIQVSQELRLSRGSDSIHGAGSEGHNENFHELS